MKNNEIKFIKNVLDVIFDKFWSWDPFRYRLAVMEIRKEFYRVGLPAKQELTRRGLRDGEGWSTNLPFIQP